MKNKVLFILLSFSLCFSMIAISQHVHRENGWYHVIDKDSLSIEPILAVNDFATLRLDTSNLGQYVIFGQISQHKIKKWASETEKAIGKQIAFVFNDSIITTPQVNAKIESGAFVITSPFDKKLPQLYKQIIENTNKNRHISETKSATEISIVSPPNDSIVQKVKVKTIKEYVNDNDFIEIIPGVYANQTSHSSVSTEEQKNLENQMVAATYRFYKHCTQDDKGSIFCNLTCGKDINISEELFQRKMKDIEETNKFVEKHLKAGTKYRVGIIDEKYLNSLLNYEAK